MYCFTVCCHRETVSADFTTTPLAGLFKLEPFSTSWVYTAHYTVILYANPRDVFGEHDEVGEFAGFQAAFVVFFA